MAIYVRENWLAVVSCAPCARGFKIGPLIAEDPQIARASLFAALSAHAAGLPLFLDTPEINRRGPCPSPRATGDGMLRLRANGDGNAPEIPWDMI